MSKELSRIDQRLLRLAGAGLSPGELEEQTGIPAGECTGRVRALLAERDWLSDLEKQRLNILDLQRVKNKLVQNLEQSPVLDAETVDVFVKASKVFAELIEGAQRVTDEQLSVVSKAQGEVFLNLLESAWGAVVARLEANNPDADMDGSIDIDDLTTVFHEALRRGAESFE